MMSFTHLHLASGYSFKYGTTLPEAMVEKAAELNMNSIALTDRDTLAGAIKFVVSCKENSISPISTRTNLELLCSQHQVTGNL
jgi:error-prone DNA polymerase